MKQREWIILGVVVGVLGLLIWKLGDKLPLGHGAGKQPDRIAGNLNTFDDIFPLAIGEHFVHPNMISDPVNLPVRYPPRAGHEISVLIEHGYAALFQPRGALTTWLECPPSEEG